MSDKRNHNTIYFLTTLSVYLGLVFVGASPQVLGQAKVSQNSQSSSFEFTTRAENLFADLQTNQVLDQQDIVPFDLSGRIFTNRTVWKAQSFNQTQNSFVQKEFFPNDQVFVILRLPRASI